MVAFRCCEVKSIYDGELIELILNFSTSMGADAVAVPSHCFGRVLADLSHKAAKSTMIISDAKLDRLHLAPFMSTYGIFKFLWCASHHDPEAHRSV